jgi:hypothetical protein
MSHRGFDCRAEIWRILTFISGHWVAFENQNGAKIVDVGHALAGDDPADQELAKYATVIVSSRGSAQAQRSGAERVAVGGVMIAPALPSEPSMPYRPPAHRRQPLGLSVGLRKLGITPAAPRAVTVISAGNITTAAIGCTSALPAWQSKAP